MEEIPLERLIGPGIVVDVTDACAQPTPTTRSRWAISRAGRKRTARRWTAGSFCFAPDSECAGRTARPTWARTNAGRPARKKLHFPGLHPEASEWLVRNRSIRAIGLDTPSIDHGQSKQFRSHVVLFEHDIPAFENVANLELLPASGFQVVALPMKIAGGSGAPLRIVAILDGKD